MPFTAIRNFSPKNIRIHCTESPKLSVVTVVSNAFKLIAKELTQTNFKCTFAIKLYQNLKAAVEQTISTI